MFFNNKIDKENSINSFLYLFLICTFSLVINFPAIFGKVNEVFMFYSALGSIIVGTLLVINNLKFMIGLFAMMPILFINLMVMLSIGMGDENVNEYSSLTYYVWMAVSVAYSIAIFMAISIFTKKCKRELKVKETSIKYLTIGFLLSSAMILFIHSSNILEYKNKIDIATQKIEFNNVALNNKIKIDYNYILSTNGIKTDKLYFISENNGILEKLAVGYDFLENKIDAKYIDLKELFFIKNKIVIQSITKSYFLLTLSLLLMIYIGFLSYQTRKGNIQFERMSKLLYFQALIMLSFYL